MPHCDTCTCHSKKSKFRIELENWVGKNPNKCPTIIIGKGADDISRIPVTALPWSCASRFKRTFVFDRHGNRHTYSYGLKYDTLVAYIKGFPAHEAWWNEETNTWEFV